MNVLFWARQVQAREHNQKILKKNLKYHRYQLEIFSEQKPLLDQKWVKSLKKIMSSGKFVSDDVVLKLVSKKITSDECQKGFILDGFPRNLSQAMSLDKLLDDLNVSIEYVFLIDVPSELIIKRCVGRITCNTCGKIENEYFSDIREGDKCGEGIFVKTSR